MKDYPNTGIFAKPIANQGLSKNMKNAWGSPDNPPIIGFRKLVTILKPDIDPVKNSTRMSKMIRDNILRDEFGYTKLDLELFNQLYRDEWVIEDTTKPNRWATDQQVMSWNNNSIISAQIVLEEPWVKAVMNFRELRTGLEIANAAAFISDTSIRQAFTQYLGIVLNSFGENRIRAFDGLMVMIAGSGATRYSINQALNFLIEQSGYKDNPFLLLALARTTVYKSTTPAFVGNEYDPYSLVDEAIMAMNRQDFTNKSYTAINKAIMAVNRSYMNPTSKTALTKIDNLEAASINRWANTMYREIDVRDEEVNHFWLERFYSMTEEESKLYKDGDFIPSIPPGVNVISPLAGSEQELQERKKEFAEKQEDWRKLDQIGSPVPPSDPRSSEYLQKSSDTYEREIWKIKKKRGTDKGYKPRAEAILTPNDYNPYSRSNHFADGFGAVFSLYLEAARWNKFDLRMRTVTEYIREKERLERQIASERVRLKPPPPEVTLKHIRAFRNQGRITANPSEKRKITIILSQLFVLLQEGQALYGKKKK